VSAALHGWSVSVSASTESSRQVSDSPDFETWDRICKLYGWPQTFAEASEPRGVSWELPSVAVSDACSGPVGSSSKRGTRSL
jgi:hypothetical protein